MLAKNIFRLLLLIFFAFILYFSICDNEVDADVGLTRYRLSDSLDVYWLLPANDSSYIGTSDSSFMRAYIDSLFGVDSLRVVTIIVSDSLFSPAADFDSLHAAHVQLDSAAYVNWENVVGSGGFGLRNNAGNIQIKSEGGSWANVVASTDTSSTLFDYDGLSLIDTLAGMWFVPRDSMGGGVGTLFTFEDMMDSTRGGPVGQFAGVYYFIHPDNGAAVHTGLIYQSSGGTYATDTTHVCPNDTTYGTGVVALRGSNTWIPGDLDVDDDANIADDVDISGNCHVAGVLSGDTLVVPDDEPAGPADGWTYWKKGGSGNPDTLFIYNATSTQWNSWVSDTSNP